jgi:hypothetical protein
MWRIQWHSSQITEEIALNEIGRRAHGTRRNKERRMRKLRCAKLSAPQPTSRRMTNKTDAQVQHLTALQNAVVLAAVEIRPS